MLTKQFKSPARQAWKRTMAVLLTLALAGVAGVAIAQMAAPKSLPSIIPQDAEVFGSVQPKWLWDATSSIRTIPDVAKCLSEFESKSGFSVDSDLLPWVGQVGYAGINLSDDHKRMVITYAQILDQDKFQDMLKAVQAKAQSQSVTITSRDYNGTTIYDVVRPGKKTQCAYAVLNGWAVAGIGKGAIEHAIDVYSGSKPAIDSTPAWQAAATHVPQQAIGWVGLNAGAIYQDIGSTNPSASGAMNMPQGKVLGVITLTDLGNGLRTDFVSVPMTPAARAYYGDFAAHVHPLTGKVLQRIPDSVMVGEGTNPAYLWKMYKTAMSASGGGSGQQQVIASIMQALKPLDDAIPYFHGDVGGAIAWRHDRGFGLVLTAQADSQPGALHAAKVIANMLKQYGIPLQRGGNSWVLAMPGLDAMTPPNVPVKLSPFISAKDNWLVIGSHPMWTSPPLDSPTIQVPADAGKPVAFGAVTFKWLPSVLDLIQEQPGVDSDAKQGIALVRGLHLDNSVWQGWSSVESTGTYMFGTGEITNWDWRTAISNTATAIVNWKPASTDKSKAAPDMSESKTPVSHGA